MYCQHSRPFRQRFLPTLAELQTILPVFDAIWIKNVTFPTATSFYSQHSKSFGFNIQKGLEHYQSRVHSSWKVWKNILFFIHFWKSLEKSGKVWNLGLWEFFCLEKSGFWVVPDLQKIFCLIFILLLFWGKQSDNFQKFSPAAGNICSQLRMHFLSHGRCHSA